MARAFSRSTQPGPPTPQKRPSRRVVASFALTGAVTLYGQGIPCSRTVPSPCFGARSRRSGSTIDMSGRSSRRRQRACQASPIWTPGRSVLRHAAGPGQVQRERRSTHGVVVKEGRQGAAGKTTRTRERSVVRRRATRRAASPTLHCDEARVIRSARNTTAQPRSVHWTKRP